MLKNILHEMTNLQPLNISLHFDRPPKDFAFINLYKVDELCLKVDEENKCDLSNLCKCLMLDTCLLGKLTIEGDLWFDQIIDLREALAINKKTRYHGIGEKDILKLRQSQSDDDVKMGTLLDLSDSSDKEQSNFFKLK